MKTSQTKNNEQEQPMTIPRETDKSEAIRQTILRAIARIRGPQISLPPAATTIDVLVVVERGTATANLNQENVIIVSRGVSAHA